MNLEFVKREQLKEKPQDETKLGFGKVFSDYMLMLRYDEAKGGWYEAKIEPFQNLSLSPASLVFHYAQECFEGMKAYKTADGEVMMFRPWDNIHRMNVSAERLCMAPIPEEFFLNAIYELIKVEKDWIPTTPGTSLYIRPTYIGIDPFVGVRAASQYMLYVILSPVGAYYASGLAPVSIYVESQYVRAVKGGTGYTKCGGNYAASLKAGEEAHQRGYSQVLWLDGRENKYIEEVGAMNIMFKINGEILTPELNGSILAGITRDSIIKLARKMGYTVTERRISMQEVADAAKNGTLEEVWGTGTAAVVSPVGELIWNGESIKVGDGGMGKLTEELYNTLTGIQYGRIADDMGWTIKL
ncbi:MAG: branched-chain amino acid aminotransferase [Clostridiales bacterium]|nr:branched-chain amino acid aminotransferase [Clostridiales bacterium]MBR2223212.1 branched-chain amino acid aminotransferase [Christensenellaceae bacterium]